MKRKFSMRHPIAKKVEEVLCNYPWFYVWLENEGPQGMRYKEIMIQTSKNNESEIERIVVKDKAKILSQMETIEEVINIMKKSDKYKNELDIVNKKYFEGKYNEKVAREMEIDINTFYKYQRSAVLIFAKALGLWI